MPVNLHNFRHVWLTDIATVERSQSGRVYPAGTIYIQVSCCARAGLQQFYILGEPSELESKYAVVVPVEDAWPLYLVEVLNLYADEFMARFVGSNMNIQMDAFRFFELDYHPDTETQIAIADVIGDVQAEIAQTGNVIDVLKDGKAYLLDKMFVQRK